MKKHRFYIAIFFSFLIIIFGSCSSSAPEISNTIVSVVFQYDDFVSLPENRLSVIVEPKSEVRRADKITVKNLGNDYVWTTDDLVLFQQNKKTYAGNTNFVMPSNQKIPAGKYEIVFENADEQNVETEVLVKYDDKILNATAEKAEKILKDKGARLKFVIYDNEDKLLYFGDKKSDFSTKEGILKSYRSAAYFRQIWSTQNDSVVCIMPSEYILEDIEASEN